MPYCQLLPTRFSMPVLSPQHGSQYPQCTRCDVTCKKTLTLCCTKMDTETEKGWKLFSHDCRLSDLFTLFITQTTSVWSYEKRKEDEKKNSCPLLLYKLLLAKSVFLSLADSSRQLQCRAAPRCKHTVPQYENDAQIC